MTPFFALELTLPAVHGTEVSTGVAYHGGAGQTSIRVPLPVRLAACAADARTKDLVSTPLI